MISCFVMEFPPPLYIIRITAIILLFPARAVNSESALRIFTQGAFMRGTQRKH